MRRLSLAAWTCSPTHSTAARPRIPCGLSSAAEKCATSCSRKVHHRLEVKAAGQTESLHLAAARFQRRNSSRSAREPGKRRSRRPSASSVRGRSSRHLLRCRAFAEVGADRSPFSGEVVGCVSKFSPERDLAAGEKCVPVCRGGRRLDRAKRSPELSLRVRPRQDQHPQPGRCCVRTETLFRRCLNFPHASACSLQHRDVLRLRQDSTDRPQVCSNLRSTRGRARDGRRRSEGRAAHLQGAVRE
jgi:hypothetical protein